MSVFKPVFRSAFSPVFGTGRKFSGVLDRIDDAAFALSSQLLTRDFLNKALYAPIRRTSDNVEANVFVDKGADPKKVTLDSPIAITSGTSAATTLGELVGEELPKSFVNQLGVTNFSSTSGDGWSADLVGTASRVQRFERFSIKSGQSVTVNFTASHGRGSLTLREGQATTISNSGSISSGANSITLTATQTSRDVRIAFIFGGSDVQEGYTISNFSAVGEDVHSAALVTGSDQSGNGNDATQTTDNAQPLIVEAGVLVDGFGKFDGTKWLRIDAGPSVMKPPEVTYAFWANAATTGNIRAIFSNRSATDNGITIWQRIDDVMVFDYRSSADRLMRWGTNYTLPTDEWVHIAFTRTASGVKLYVDGALQDSTADAGGEGSGASFAALGGRDGAGNFDGVLDHFLVFPRALSASEIAAIHNAL